MSRIRSGKVNSRMMYGTRHGGHPKRRYRRRRKMRPAEYGLRGGMSGGFQGPGGMAYTDIDCSSACASVGNESGGYGPPTEAQFDHCWEQCTYYFGAHSGIM